MGIRAIESTNMFSFNMNDMVYINANREIVDKEIIKRKLERYNESIDIINNGNYYKLKSFCRDIKTECWEVASKDKSEILLVFDISLLHNNNFKRIKLKGLNEDAVYINKETNEVFLGGALMHCGVNIKKLYGNHTGDIIHLKML